MDTFYADIFIDGNPGMQKSATICRFWAYIPQTTSWLMKLPTPDNNIIPRGKSVTILNNLAILVEAVIGEILIVFCENDAAGQLNSALEKLKNNATWKAKKVFFKPF